MKPANEDVLLSRPVKEAVGVESKANRMGARIRDHASGLAQYGRTEQAASGAARRHVVTRTQNNANLQLSPKRIDCNMSVAGGLSLGD
jgi:hypothetical protein